MNKNITDAIETENVYLHHKINGKECPYQLEDEIKKYGYTSLDEYFNDKREYLFGQLNFHIKDVPPSRCIEEGWSSINNKITSVFFVDTPETTVYVHTSKPYNEKFCVENNLPVYKLPSGGGTIVSGDKDIVIAFVLPDTFGVDSYFILDKITTILRKYRKDVCIVDNDIMINSGKICGITYLRGNGMIAFLAHFSFSDNLSDLIQHICHVDNKNIKVPSYLTELNRQMLRTEVIEWLQCT